MERIYYIEELAHIVSGIVQQLREANLNLVLLEGDLGAGKTTFTQLLAKELGVVESLVSPTFVLMKSYQTQDMFYTKLIHIDGYRIDDGSLYEVLNLKPLLENSQNCMCVEWPERIPELEAFSHCKIKLIHIDELTRKIIVTFIPNKT